MSWLSEILGLDDNSAKKSKAAQKASATASSAAAKKKAAATKKSEAAAKSTWSSGKAAAAAAAKKSAQQYFTNMGLDPANYETDIDNAINEASSSVAEGGDYSSVFQGIGEEVYNNLTSAGQTKATSAAETAESGGPTIADTADDSIIEAILNTQKGGATKFAENMKKRGVITGTGYDAAIADILNQYNTAGGTLSELGDEILGGGRSKLEEIWNKAKETASGLKLGQSYDASTYSTDAQNSFDDFMENLESVFKSKAPTDLFDTSGLGNIAGQAQGAQNLAFKPNAGSTTYEEEEDEDENETVVF